MYINKFKKIVIKIGSSILVDEHGKPKKKNGFTNLVKISNILLIKINKL